MKRHVLNVFLIVLLALWAGDALALGEEAGTGTGGGSAPTIEGDSAAARPLFEQGQTAYVQAEFAQAAELFQRAYDAWHHPAFLYNRGQALVHISRWQDALAAFQQYVSTYESSGLPAEQFETLVHVQIAECLHRLNRRDEATQALRLYLEASPQGDLAPAVRQCVETGASPSTIGARDPATVRAARQAYEQALALHRRGQYREAAESFLQAYDRLSDVTELLYNAASSYRAARMWNEAIREYERYMMTTCPDAEAYIQLAQCYHQQANYERAMQAYRNYLAREPRGIFAEDARQYIESMASVLAMSNEAQPQETVEQASRIFSRGFEHYSAGRYRQALQDFSEAHDLVPTRQTQYNIGMCYYHLREWLRALTQFENYLRNGDTGEHAMAHLYAAECLLELERWGEAQHHIQDYLARADEAELPQEERDRARAQRLMQRVREASGAGGSE
jgi:tetratricopeptide (TPR) repeat protein